MKAPQRPGYCAFVDFGNVQRSERLDMVGPQATNHSRIAYG